MTYRVVFEVEKVPSREGIGKTVKEIWSSEGKEFAEFTVWGYLPEMDAQSYAYVTAEFTPAGLKGLQIQNNAAYGTKWWNQLRD